MNDINRIERKFKIKMECVLYNVEKGKRRRIGSVVLGNLLKGSEIKS